MEVAGSYRRGKLTCGDIDLLITKREGGKVDRGILVQFVDLLHKKGFVTDHLSMPREFDGHGSVLYMGVCRYQTERRMRIDIKCYPVQQYAFALLYFTGS